MGQRRRGFSAGGPGVFIIGSAILLLGGCGGSRATAPSAAPTPIPTPPPPSVLTVTDGDTGRPVVGAEVRVAGTPLRTDAAGQVQLVGAAIGATIDVIAEGYLDRQTLVRAGSESLARFSLWPRQPLSRFDENYTNKLVYISSTIGLDGTSSPLRRLGPGTTQVRIILSPELFADETSRFFHQFAADAMNTAVSGKFRYTVGSDPVAGYFPVTVSVNPAGSSCNGNTTIAYASVGTNGGGEISSVSITYCAAKWGRDGGAILHEMGHTLGLRHSSERGDVMYPFVGVDVFTDRELLIMKLMYQRPAGNTFPDNDRATIGIASARLDTVVCSR